MKSYVLSLVITGWSLSAMGQSQEAQQLLLNVEKLAQFKKILENMKTGYQVLHKGYTGIKAISEGNFNLHKVFLDALLEVSPGVRKYKRIADIITYQRRIVKEYKMAFAEFKSGGQFTADEIGYLTGVYGSLLAESVNSLDELSIVITAGRLRMSDDERLRAVDRIYNSITEQYRFLQEFNNNTALLSVQRKSEKVEIELGRRLRRQ